MISFKCKISDMQRSRYEINNIMKQIISGVQYLHSLEIIHCDLKPANILIGDDGVIKIIDLEFAQYNSNRIDSDIQTLQYKSIEILLGDDNWSYPVDIWSLGCIYMELITGEIFLQGKDHCDQILQIYKTFGKPTENEWPGVIELPDYTEVLCCHKDRLKDICSVHWVNYDCLSKFFIYNPSKRITITEVASSFSSI